jgi:hypothetical protein
MAVPVQRRPVVPKPGNVFWVGPAASVQFAGQGFDFRVTFVDPAPTYAGWLWLTGYVVKNGRAVEHRSIFVQIAGLRPAHHP